jgi:hypothetical protein
MHSRWKKKRHGVSPLHLNEITHGWPKLARAYLHDVPSAQLNLLISSGSNSKFGSSQ